MINVTTDPVELWSAETSRVRIEKDYYDDTFVPFYRTEQVIVRAPGLEPYIHETYGEGNVTFAGILNTETLLEVRRTRGGGGNLYFKLDIILVKGLSKHTLNKYFQV